MTIDSAKRLAYELDRREHTAQCALETNRKPKEGVESVFEGGGGGGGGRRGGQKYFPPSFRRPRRGS